MKEYCKVLIVDDEYIMRQGMKHMLEWEKEGFTIVGEASNGEEALELIEKLKPHIILSDIVMPVINGMEFSQIVQEKYPEIQIIILSSFDNFEYVKTTLLSGVVDYILKPTLNPADLLITMNKAVERIPNFELSKNEGLSYKKLLERYLLGFEQNLDTAAFFECFPDTCFRLLGINLKQCCKGNKTLINEIKSIVDKYFASQEHFKAVRMTLNGEILCCVINYKISHNVNVINKIGELLKNKKLCRDNYFFVLTKEFKDIGKVKSVYEEELIPHLADRFYYKDSNFLVLDDVDHNYTENLKFDFDEYYNLIKYKKYNEAIGDFQKYIQKLIARNKDEYSLKNLTKNLLYNLAVNIDINEITTDDIRRGYFKKIDNAENIEEFQSILQEIIIHIKGVLAESDDEQNKVNEIIKYIDNHYEEHLELIEIAKVFNFNYYYLSSYFNTHSKEGFNEYLNKIRVKKACELLKNSSIAVAEVSNSVGYSDHSYFCRVFKKIVGITPSKYRRSEMIKAGEADEV